MTTTQLSELSFGIELEMLIKPREQPSMFKARLQSLEWIDNLPADETYDKQGDFFKREHNRDILRQVIAEELNREVAGIEAEVGECYQFYDKWTIHDEISLDELAGYYRIEHVSRILSTEDKWPKEIDRVMSLINKYNEIEVTPACSMHCHVSPGVGETFTDKQLQALCKAICYFDDAITAVLPGDRKDNWWAASNVRRGDRRAVVADWYDEVGRGKPWAYLFRQLDLVTRGNVIEIMQGSRFSRDKYVGWNFRYIEQECGTVEFRRPPPAKTTEDACHWVAFTVGFVSAALSYDWRLPVFMKDGNKPRVSELRDFVRFGLGQFETPSISWRAIDFSRIVANSSLPTTEEEMEANREEFRRRMATKVDQESPFATKIIARSRCFTPESCRSSESGRSKTPEPRKGKESYRVRR